MEQPRKAIGDEMPAASSETGEPCVDVDAATQAEAEIASGQIAVGIAETSGAAQEPMSNQAFFRKIFFQK